MSGTDVVLPALRSAFVAMVPSCVAIAVACIGTVDDLFAAERELVARAIPARRAEFAAARWCARRALDGVGACTGPILRGALGQPLWPDRYGGSITHEGGIAVAAAYRIEPDRARLHLGIDMVGCTDRLAMSEIASVVLSERDRALIAHRGDPVLAIAEVFSAKEAAVKILSVELGAFIELLDLQLSPDAEGYVITHPGCDLRIASRRRVVGPFIATVATSLR